MKIGIVTARYERGAAYVSRHYMEMLEREGHQVSIYARGNMRPDRHTEKWNESYVTWDNTYQDTRIDPRRFFRWIKKEGCEVVFFNEQQDFRILCAVKKRFPELKIGAYVDYYTERTRAWFRMYDFLICNTHRHMQAMEGHPQAYYIRWGTDVDVFRPVGEKHDMLTFFHSVGMSVRKGTDLLIDAFIEGNLCERSRLIIHTQLPISRVTQHSVEELANHGITVIEKTVTAPGLYHMGDVYVYPTRLDGLGLTMYEAAACGLPIITTDFPPMNEAVERSFGRLVKVRDYYCRQDAYYYPMAVCDQQDLIAAMQWYVDHPEEVAAQKRAARRFAEENYRLSDRSHQLSEIFQQANLSIPDRRLMKEIENYYRKEISSFHEKINNYTITYQMNVALHRLIGRI